MTSDAINPQKWLTENPLRPGEQLYAVISSTSDADPLIAYRQNGGVTLPRALWTNTPYAGWLPVMPYLLSVPCDNGFVQWAADTNADDWGWLAISSEPPEHVTEHLRSLTVYTDICITINFIPLQHFLMKIYTMYYP